MILLPSDNGTFPFIHSFIQQQLAVNLLYIVCIIQHAEDKTV